MNLVPHLGLDLVGVAPGQLLLSGCWDDDVTRGLQDASFIGGGAWEAHYGPIGLAKTTQSANQPTNHRPVSSKLACSSTPAQQREPGPPSLTHQLVVLQLLGVDAAGVPDVSVQLAHPDTLGPEAVQVAHRVQAHVAEALQVRPPRSVSISITS